MIVRTLLAGLVMAMQINPAAAQSDTDPGKRAFMQCRACHTLEANGRNLNGPNLHGVFGAKAGTRPGYAYSAAMAKAGFIWTDDQLSRFLVDPRATVPKNKMVFLGVKDPAARRALIAYLKTETSR